MDLTTWTLVGLIALALLFDYTNGFHDSANSIATVVATRVLRPRWAVLWAAVWNFAARPVSGFAAETAAAVAIIGSTSLGAPVSTTHTVAGAITGVGTTKRHGGELGRVSLVVMGLILVGLLGALLIALRRAPKAADVEPDEDEEFDVPLRPGAGSVIDGRRVPVSREVSDRDDGAAEAPRREARASQPL